MNPLNLLFRKQNLNNTYLNNFLSEQTAQHYSAIFILLASALMNLIYDILYLFDKTQNILNIVSLNLLLIAILFLLMKRLREYFFMLILHLFFYYFVFFRFFSIVFSKSLYDEQASMQFIYDIKIFYRCFLLGSICIISTFYICKHIIFIIFCVLLFLVTILVYLFNFLGFSLIIGGVFIMTNMGYIEYYSKRSYYRLIQKQNNLKIWKELIINRLNKQIFIFQRKGNGVQLQYINNAASVISEDELKQIILRQNLTNIKKDSQIYIDKIGDFINNFDSVMKEIPEEETFQTYFTLNDKQNTITKSISIQICKVVFDGKISILLILADISLEIIINQLKELDSYKNQLLSTVSHDLKTPLNSMVANLEIAMRETDHVQRNTYLKTTLNNIRLQQFIINDIIDFSRIKQKQIHINSEKFDLLNLVEDLQALFKAQFDLKKLEFKIDNTCGNIILITDLNRIKQILNNLISNAIKFTVEGSVSLLIEKQEQNILIFRVKDTGIGIDSKIESQLFGEYQTFDQRGMNRFGVGLGLLISKQLVGMLGPKETIDLKSEVGKGSEFSFKIFRNLNMNEFDEMDSPIKDSSRLIRTQQIKLLKTTNIKSLMTSLKIIIIDDSVFNIEALQLHLVFLAKKLKINIVISTALNGQQALNQIQEQDKLNNIFDILFIDLEMPVMNGWETAKQLRNRKYQGFLVALTAYHLQQGQKGVDLFDSCLEKPIFSDTMEALLLRFLKRADFNHK